ncbi:DUF6166 domain-containing protein [Geoalkalibacter halelectricus]|nr:DUF6166 domain-containing protein [Geoalkalibacter halelectricus]
MNHEPNIFIHGDVDSLKVWIGNQELSPDPSLKLQNHSPNGFAWGYLGSGPAHLALAILLEFTDQASALRLYQQFKEDVIACLNIDEDFALSISDVKKWVADKTQK